MTPPGTVLTESSLTGESIMTVTEAVCTEPASRMAVGTAAQELRPKRGEFAIAVHVGLVRVLVQQSGLRSRTQFRSGR